MSIAISGVGTLQAESPEAVVDVSAIRRGSTNTSKSKNSGSRRKVGAATATRPTQLIFMLEPSDLVRGGLKDSDAAAAAQINSFGIGPEMLQRPVADLGAPFKCQPGRHLPVPPAGQELVLHIGVISPVEGQQAARFHQLSPTELDQLKVAINAGFAELKKKAASVLVLQLRLGRLLLIAKNNIDFGDFERWAQEHITEASRAWRHVLMQQAEAEPYFKRAQIWAKAKDLPASARKRVLLVQKYRIDIGELEPKPKKQKSGAAEQPICAAPDEDHDFARALAAAKQRHSEDADCILGLKLRLASLSLQFADLRALAVEVAERLRARETVSAELIHELLEFADDDGLRE